MALKEHVGQHFFLFYCVCDHYELTRTLLREHISSVCSGKIDIYKVDKNGFPTYLARTGLHGLTAFGDLLPSAPPASLPVATASQPRAKDVRLLCSADQIAKDVAAIRQRRRGGYTGTATAAKRSPTTATTAKRLPTLDEVTRERDELQKKVEHLERQYSGAVTELRQARQHMERMQGDMTHFLASMGPR